MTSLALAFDILARDKGASATFNRVGEAANRTGLAAQTAGRRGSAFGTSLKKAAGVAAAATGAATAGIVAGLGASINKAMDYDKTMRLVGATLGTTGKQQRQLGALAMKMGADTVFSAKDAGDAMLELAKGGISTANIQGGALQATMVLAAAGTLEMGSAATYVGNTLNTFGLKAKDASSVAAALAGGANASSASVESLGEALSQVGPGAKTAGLSLQETVGVLAAFDNAGIKGSDAGTTLKTMLTRLVPQTKKATEAMSALGLKFTDARGEFLPMSAIAQQLQDKLKGLSAEQRTTALATIFGSDATRAASVLMDIGAAGVNKYTKATSDQAAAQRMANTQMEGASGAWEAFKGSVETLAISVGLKLLPTFTKVVGWLTTMTNTISTKVGPVITRFIGWFKADLWPALQQGYQTVLPAINRALAIVSGGLQSNGISWRQVGDFITQKVIPVVAKMIAVYLPLLATQIRTQIETVKALWKAFETWRSIVSSVISFVLKRFSDLAGMWATVLSALGHVPGFGWATDAAKKLNGAAASARGVASALDNIDRNVKINVAFRATSGRLTVGGQSVNIGMRAGGGQVSANSIYQVGDNPDGSWNKTTELFTSSTAGRIVNQAQMRKALGADPAHRKAVAEPAIDYDLLAAAVARGARDGTYAGTASGMAAQGRAVASGRGSR